MEIRINEMEKTLGKRIDDAEERMIKRIYKDLENINQEEDGKREKMIQTVKTSLASKKKDIFKRT